MHKPFYLLFILLLVGCSATKKVASTSSPALSNMENDFTTYMDYFFEEDYDTMLTYIPPELFEVLPKEQMKALFQSVFSDPDIEIKLDPPKVLSRELYKVIEDKQYGRLRYSGMMYMKVRTADDETEEDTEFMLDMIQVGLNESFGAVNVKHNSETGFFEIFTEKNVVAVSENGESDWKFVTIEENMKPLLKRVFPKEIIDWE